MADYSIVARGLDVGYNGKIVVGNINIDIRSGEIVALIGPNGAGKSTILKSIARQLGAIAGLVEIYGRELSSISARQLAQNLAVVLTDRVKPELMTCRDVVATGRYPYTGRLGILSADDQRHVDAALAAVGASELSDRDFCSVSDGQRQRILLARAICQQPKIIILDEPTSFLDIRHKLELLKILHKMARDEDITVVMSLHEIDLAQKIADRVLCVNGDAVMKFGTPDNVFTDNGIRELYAIDNGFYDPLFGSAELPRIEGTPEVFVLSSAGTGIPVYRRLQRENIPFVAGILYENDVDYRLARILAVETVCEKSFAEITDDKYERARFLVSDTGRFINAGVTIGGINRRIADLISLAKAIGKYEEA